ncbi:MAG: bifunctional [glutamine synthetase] adenylyltransferase/[glutamine synthetase]-adenylyl-L-tyrosine phosphorylase [Acetobacteraceae bacterium]|nr:bifunctional [glutamine synthetase] adenylyltransferase/[glutamine synthetase]-adenylyl-L-tyrosine phosphorylase [Acetobacteraceae bacterium]MDW8397679.1 bifunctional [glutamine synthetase] adenylyltransferase/[glutamine synthetase]-adenylyl-L-tyrosine phosphorylase [Acetobacteraceae bacterium]
MPPPAPHDPEAADRLIAAFRDLGRAERDYAETAAGRALLAAIGGHSPYLSDLALREPAVLLRMAERGPDAAFAAVLAPLARIEPESPRPALASLLRQVKRRGALLIGAADIAGLWPLARVTAALSDLAEQAVDHAAAHLLREAAARGAIRLPGARGGLRDPRRICRGSGFVVLGMGKLGARELNYSSDIDLIVLYDPAAAYHEEEAGPTFVRLARDLVRLLEERTAEGYVFRTDLRLRPDPAATPLAVSLPAAISYYESMGLNWERAAMSKARPVAGDRAAGEAFLAEIKPFVWRRHLDFAMMSDIAAVRRQIHAARAARGAHAEVRLPGLDIKLGRGGIREIEFVAQVLQLIWGGRDPALRDPTTLGALAGLSAAGRLDRRAAADLADAYNLLRTVEHRLQMIEDRQTHRLPEDPAGMARLASFLGFPDAAAFEAALAAHLHRVAGHYARLFDAAPEAEAAAPGPSLSFSGPEDTPETLSALRGLGFADPEAAALIVRGWLAGRYAATRSERARELMSSLLPGLLAALGRQRSPNEALARFDRLLSRLGGGVQLFSLFARNPPLIERVAVILGAAPALAEHLSRTPAALDGLLAEGSRAPARVPLKAVARDARHFEEALSALRRAVVERSFEVDVAALEGKLDADAAGELRSATAEAAIGALLPAVRADFAQRHGSIRGGGMAVVALGKLGGREMLPGSDLDLVLVYDHPEGIEESSGGLRRLPPPSYFAKLAQAFVGALTAPGAEGRLYEVDMRLRPSGSKGPVAVSLAAFRRYHAESAWTWERMALTRARVLAGPPALKRAVRQAIREALVAPRATDPIADARAMRARMLREAPPEGPWDVKAMRGGLTEVEFVAQALQLAAAARHPAVLRGQTRACLAALAREGILPREEAAALVRADRLWRTLLGLLRLTVGRWREERLPEPVAAAVLHAIGPCLPEGPAVDQAGLRAQMARVAERVAGIFDRLIGPPTSEADTTERQA